MNHAPDGWQGFASNWQRDGKYHGIARKIEIPFRFVKEGAEFLREEYDKYRTNAKTQIKIERFDRQTYTYSVCYHGEIDYSKMVDGMSVMSVDYFDVAITELGMRKMLDAREKSTFEIALNDEKTIRVVNPANAWQECEWDVIAEEHVYWRQDPYGDWDEVYNVSNSYLISCSDIVSDNLLGKDIDQAITSKVLWDAGKNVIVWFRKTRELEEPITMNFLFEGELINASGVNVSVLCWDTNDDGETVSATETTTIAIDYSEYPKVRFIFPLFFKDVHRNCALRIFVDSNPGTGHSPYGGAIRGKLRMSGFSEPLLDPFDIKAISLYDTFKTLTEKVADTEITNPTAVSELMTSGALKDIYLTSGDGIRGIGNAVIKTSFVDFFDSLFGVFPIAMFVSPTGLVIEGYDKAFRTDSMIIDLGEARSMIVKPATDWMFNQITVGSQDKDYKSANGRFEFNTENYFTGPLLRISNHVSMVGKYRTDSFGVTDTRLTHEKQSTTTGDADNDVFFIHAVTKSISIDGSPPVAMLVPFDDHVIVEDELQKGRSGIFNLFFSPKRCLMRHGRIISGILQGTGTGTKGHLTFETTGKTDARLVSKVSAFGETANVVEREGYDVDLSNPVWLPEIYEIECRKPRDLVAAMDEKEGGYVRFSFRGKTYCGFPIDVQQEEYPTNPQQTIKLLAAPETMNNEQ